MTKDLFKLACLHFLKLPYIWGGDDSVGGFDCSGLAQELLAMVGLDPLSDQTAQAIYDHFKTKSKDTKQDTGALAFYGKSRQSITHVAVFLDAATIIEAGGGGSKTKTREDAEKQNAYTRLRRFDNRPDLIAVLRPKGLPWDT
jgi:cell wall-associated NlpC family hydrolase